jgi:hypothetical protein
MEERRSQAEFDHSCRSPLPRRVCEACIEPCSDVFCPVSPTSQRDGHMAWDKSTRRGLHLETCCTQSADSGVSHAVVRMGTFRSPPVHSTCRLVNRHTSRQKRNIYFILTKPWPVTKRFIRGIKPVSVLCQHLVRGEFTCHVHPTVQHAICMLPELSRYAPPKCAQVWLPRVLGSSLLERATSPLRSIQEAGRLRPRSNGSVEP